MGVVPFLTNEDFGQLLRYACSLSEGFREKKLDFLILRDIHLTDNESQYYKSMENYKFFFNKNFNEVVGLAHHVSRD